MAIKLCIFNLDGVLVYINKFNYIAWKQIADELQIPFNSQLHESFRGMHREQCLTRLLDMKGLKLADERKHRLIERHSRLVSEGLGTLSQNKVFPGAIDLLKKLKSKDIKIGLSSGGYHAKQILRLINIAHYFDHVIDGRDFNYSTSQPEIYLEQCRHFGVEPQECLAFLGGQNSAEVAKSLGMYTIGFGTADEIPSAHQHVINYENFDIVKQLAHLDQGA